MFITKRMQVILEAYPIKNFEEGVEAFKHYPYKDYARTTTLKKFDLFAYLEDGAKLWTSLSAEDVENAAVLKESLGKTKEEMFQFMLETSSHYDKETKTFHAEPRWFQEWSPAHDDGLYLVFSGEVGVVTHPEDSEKTMSFGPEYNKSIVEEFLNILLMDSDERTTPIELFERKLAYYMSWVM